VSPVEWRLLQLSCNQLLTRVKNLQLVIFVLADPEDTVRVAGINHKRFHLVVVILLLSAALTLTNDRLLFSVVFSVNVNVPRKRIKLNSSELCQQNNSPE
jgi:hypothetical protein